LLVVLKVPRHRPTNLRIIGEGIEWARMADNTPAQHLGFADPDLGSPEHDRLVTWLPGPENLLAILQRAWPEVLDEKRAGV